MKAAIIGYGKMGREIEKILLERGHRVGAVIDDGRTRRTWTPHTCAGIDVALEFTTPDDGLRQHPGVHRRTGLRSSAARRAGRIVWRSCSSCCREKGGALFYASNYCLGVNLMFRLNRQAGPR